MRVRLAPCRCARGCPPASAAWRPPACARRRAGWRSRRRCRSTGQGGARRPRRGAQDRGDARAVELGLRFAAAAPRPSRRRARPRRTPPCRRRLRATPWPPASSASIVKHHSRADRNSRQCGCLGLLEVRRAAASIPSGTGRRSERAAQQLEAQVQQLGVGGVGLAVVADRRRSRPPGRRPRPARRRCRSCPASRRAAPPRRAARSCAAGTSPARPSGRGAARGSGRRSCCSGSRVSSVALVPELRRGDAVDRARGS